MAATKKDATTGLNGMLAVMIRGEMKTRGITREALAKGAGISFDALKNYPSTSPTRAVVMDIDVVERIARALGMTMRDLIDRAEGRLAEQQLEGLSPETRAHILRAQEEIAAAIEAGRRETS